VTAELLLGGGAQQVEVEGLEGVGFRSRFWEIRVDPNTGGGGRGGEAGDGGE
jgi:hypothetical protein